MGSSVTELGDRLRLNPRHVDLGLRIICTLAFLEGALAIGLGLTDSPNIRLANSIFTAVFLASAAFMFVRQPQFAAFFALLGTVPAGVVLMNTGHTDPQLWLLLPALLWYVLQEHPARAKASFVPFILFFSLSSVLASLPLFLGIAEGIFWPAWSLLLIGALITLSQRCLAEGLHRSPRTIVFVAGFAPIATGYLLAVLGIIPSAGEPMRWVMAIALCLTPAGALLNEVALRMTAERTLHERQENA